MSFPTVPSAGSGLSLVTFAVSTECLLGAKLECIFLIGLKTEIVCSCMRKAVCENSTGILGL